MNSLFENAAHTVLTVRACDRNWELARPADLESLWAAMTDFANEDERLPYWTEIWPASVVLAEWLQEHAAELRDRPCLDLGCGLGLTAVVGQWLGARVLGMDYETEALRYACHNGQRNLPSGAMQPLWVTMDWRRPAVRRGSFSHIWGGDIMYERRFASPVLDFLDYALAGDGVVWVAEPCRAVYDSFRTILASRGWVARRVLECSTPALYPQEKAVPVRIWQIVR